PPSGSCFPVGVNRVCCTATDDFGNQGQCGFYVNVTGTPPPFNDACANAIAVGNGSPAACGTTVCATPSAALSIPPPCGLSANSPDVWYTYTPPCRGLVTIDTCGLCPGQPFGFNTVLSVYT